MRSASFAGGLLPLVLVACARGDEPVPNVLPPIDAAVGAQPEADIAILGRVRLVHLSADAGPVDVYLDGGPDPIVEDLRFLRGTTYLSVPIGLHTVDLAPAGAGFEAAVLSTSLEVEERTDITAAAYGTVANQSLAVLPLVDDPTGLAPNGVRLQIAHVADGVGEVDLYVMEEDTPLLPDVAFGQSASIDGPAGAVRMGLDVDEDLGQDFVFSVPDLGMGAVVDVFAVNTRGNAVLLAAVLPDSSISIVRYDPRVRVLHASPTTPLVDVLVDGAMPPAITNLAFGEGTRYLNLPADRYDFQVVLTGQGGIDPAALEFDRRLRVGRSYTAVAYGSLPQAMILVDLMARLDPNDTRFKFLHGAEGVGPVSLVDDATREILLADLQEGGIDRIDVLAGPQAFGLDLGMDGTVDAVFDLPDLGADTLVDVVVVLDGGVPKLVAHLPDGTGMVIDPR